MTKDKIHSNNIINNNSKCREGEGEEDVEEGRMNEEGCEIDRVLILYII